MRVLGVAVLVLIAYGAAAAQTGPAWNGHGYALIVGIRGYPKFRETDQLRYPDADARMFADFLKTPAAGAFPPDHIRVLLNEAATRSGIYDEIAWISRRANSDDIVYIFFAGHGVLDDSDQAYFMPYDGDPSDPYALGIRADTFLRDLRHRITAKQMLFFIDACHAAAVYTEHGVAARSADNIVPAVRAVWEQELSHLQELNMGFLSAAANQVSMEDEQLRHGVFTWFLVQGLNGAADADGDKRVTAGELRNYLVTQVEAWSRQHSGLQTPTTSPSFDADRVLSVLQTPAPPAQAPAPGSGALSKLGPPRRTTVPVVQLAASYRANQEDPKRYKYAFDVSLQGGADLAATFGVTKVTYVFDTPGNVFSESSTLAKDGFVVTYNGWGCYRTVHVTLTLATGDEAKQDLNLCKALKWE